jgi:hypothetical protein
MTFMREREASRFIEIFAMDKDDGDDVNGRSTAVDILRKFTFRKVYTKNYRICLSWLATMFSISRSAAGP